MYDIRSFGGKPTPFETRTLALANLKCKWLRYRPGTTADVRIPLPGAALATSALQTAIDAVSVAGGGTVSVPAGDWFVAPIRLRSHVELHLKPGARLWASPDLADYAAQAHLVLAEDAEEVALTGSGEIHGQSPVWAIPWMNGNPTGWQSIATGRPSKMLLFRRCRHVRVEGIRIYDSPRWTLTFQDCRHVAVRGIFIRNFELVNADGIDIVDSQHVTVSDCDIHTTDDGIVMKNDNTLADPAGVRFVAVTNCIVRSWCNAIKIGTESSGAFEDIVVGNVVVHNTDPDLTPSEGALNIALCDGGHVRNVLFHDIVMRDVGCPFYFAVVRRRGKQEKYREPRAGLLEHVTVANVRATGCRWTPFIAGWPGLPARDIALENIHIVKTMGFESAMPPLPVMASDEQYPMPFMFQKDYDRDRSTGDSLPAHGLYLRDVEKLRMRDYEVMCEGGEDARPLIYDESNPPAAGTC